ncbi:formyltetrahydrofolate deformylase [Membranicola marinus]|uniref:Formyltetrahydrofolate deformylase n=1 Tax=Membranihabitans marinus TaxID=1227546 RepID=A0A953HRW8_9BACT|nr:formyltetrahydrofolate deformylase [Membranihabitans marinus]MBY5957245.1 formyltetrahydrofolate deformylase [Membranihabitans marinus]
MILKITCTDTKGLIYKVTKCLYEAGLNIVKNDEYVDTDVNRFFMRTEYEGNEGGDAILERLKSLLPKDAKIKLTPDRRRRIILMASKEHHCLSDIVNRCENDDLQADIQCVISNHEVLRKSAARYDIPFYFIDHRKYSRQDHEKKILEVIDQYDIDYIILAKYMRILSSDFVQKYRNRMINIHHSFLPAFKGARPYNQAYMRGVKVIGASAHFVSEDLDEGPIIEQDTIRVHHGYSPREMAKAGKDVEKIVLARALDLVFQEKVFIQGNKTIVF